jgi:type IV secretion system protein VirB4
MVRLAEHRRQLQGLPDLLLYDSLIADGVMLLQDGALLAAWKFHGPDTASATHAEMAALSARLNAVLRLGDGWMIQCDAIRSRAPEYPEGGAFPDDITQLIDEERRGQFLAEGSHYESEYFLALTFLPPEQRKSSTISKVASARSRTSSGRSFKYSDCVPTNSSTHADSPSCGTSFCGMSIAA